MKAESWQRCVALFHQASELPPNERGRFLDTACAGEAETRRQVEVMLQAHGASGDFLGRPALAGAPDLLGEDPDALIGQTLGHYRIDSLLGRGGMGLVYLAHDARLGRKVALKLLPVALVADARHLARLLREARTASALNHPNIVTIHEIGEAGGKDYVAAEYIEGITLRERIARGPLPLPEALEIARQIASALAVAHEAGIVHRDIKPENIMLRHDGLVKVLDFGVARLNAPLADATLRVTSPGLILGTVAYMSPEQARGREVDARSDIWSAGVVLYEMLTGFLPFPGSSVTDVIIAIVERAPAPFPAAAPNEGREIIRQALAKEPADRPQTARELLAELTQLQRALEGGAPGWRRRRPARWLFAGLILIALLAFFFFRSAPGPSARIDSLAVLPLANHSGDAAQDYFAEGMTDALISDLAKVGALRVSSRPSVMRFKSTDKSLPQISRELKVDALLTGSVARAGTRVRVAVQLTRAGSEQHLWAETYDRALGDVPALQREVARDVVSQIRGRLTPREEQQFGSARPVNSEAYDEYLRGQYYLSRQSREGNEAAIAALERAVATDGNFAEAQAALAQAYVWKLFLFSPDEKRWAEKAFVATEKALALDPNSAVAHLARGRLLWTPANRFPHEAAIREYRRALALNPNLDEAHHQLALVYSHVGALEEALTHLREAVALNPANALAQYRIGETLLFQGNNEEALRVLRSAPSEVNPSLIGHQIALALFHLGRTAEASATLERFLKDYPEDNRGLYTSVQAMIAAAAGEESVAEEKIASAIERGKGFGHFHHTAYHIACAYSLLRKTISRCNGWKRRRRRASRVIRFSNRTWSCITCGATSVS